MYGVGSYFTAKITMDTPILILSPFIAANIMYWPMGLEYSFTQFAQFYLSLFLMGQCAASLGYFVSTAFTNEVIGLALAPLAAMPMILFGGYMANNESMDPWLEWVQYISPIRYNAEALLQTEFKNDQYEVREFLMEFIGYRLGYWNCIYIFLGGIVLFRFMAYLNFKRLVTKFQ